MSRIFLCGIVFQLSVFTLAFSMEGKGQSQSVYDIHLQLNAGNETLRLDQALFEIEMKTDFKFSFIDQEIDASTYQIRLSKEETILANVLVNISKQTNLSFRRVNENIFIKKDKSGQKRIVEVIQSIVSGRVTDEYGEVLPGATVMEKGTSNGTVTDIDGKYSLTVVGPESIISFSYVGFTTQEVVVGNQSKIDVALSPDISSLEEVVVVGYGTQKKEEVTSSLASVDQKEFVQGSVVDAGQLLQGKVAGLTVANPSGDPTGGTQILLRGNTTLLGTNRAPLVLINGVPGDLKLVAPEDIESISVLKDGSAAAIYGTRGTNGVILITTKSASDDYTSSVDYSANFSTQQITRELDMLSAEDYRQEIADGLRAPGQDLGYSTDWMDEITRTPFSQIHNITFRGGNAKTNYLVSGNVRDLEGIFVKSDNRTYTGRVDVNHNMFDNKLRFNLGIISRTRRFNNTGDGVSFNGYTYRQALIRNPTAPVKNDDGSWNEDVANFNYENPVSRLQESDGEIRSQNTRLTGTVIFEPIKGLQFKSLMSYNQYNDSRGYAESRDHISTLRDGRNGFVSNGSRDVEERLIELTAQYSLNSPDHSLTVLGGYGYQDTYGRDFWLQNNNFQTDAFSYHNPGLGKGLQEGEANMGGGTWSTNLISFFGRASYSFKDRYLISGSMRYEAASQLYGTENPWGLFPAISAGWRLENESFMSGVDFVNQLKIRAGYGVTGNPNDEGFRAVTLLTYGTPFFYDGQWINTIYTAQNPNPDLKWEEKHETNIGIDFGLFDNRVSGTVDFYRREIKDLLFDYSVPTPPNLAPTTRANVGVMENKGVEVLLNITPIETNDFTWTTSFLFSTNSNKLVSLSNDLYETQNDWFTTGGTGEPIQTHTHIVEVGKEIGNFHGFKVVDIDDNGQWIYETAEGGTATYDEFGRGFEDKQVLGNGLPNYYAGWNNSFRYKNFDLNITMRGAFDYQLLNFERMYLENPSITNYNRLSSSQELVFGKSRLTSPLEYNSYYIEDADFWKIDNITLGYNLPVESVDLIQSARVYVSTLNTFIFTGYKGIDPEVNRGGLDPGNDGRDKYPTARTFTVGFNVSF